MKMTFKVILTGVVLTVTVFCTSSFKYDYKIDKKESKDGDDDEDSPMSKFVKDCSISRVVDEEILKIKKEKADEELKLYRQAEKERRLQEERRIEEAKEIERKKELEKKNKKKIASASRGISMSVPRSNTSRKTYMDYRAITSTNSPQYKLQHSGNVYTDNNGFRRVGDKFIVAVGTYFTSNVGSSLIIKLDSGTTFEAIVGDIKANKDTDNQHIQHSSDGSVVEFLVDTNTLEPAIKKMGNCSYSKVYNFKGNIQSITVIENK